MLPFPFSYLIHFIDVKTEYSSYKAIASLLGIRLRSVRHSPETSSSEQRLCLFSYICSSGISSAENKAGKSHGSTLREWKGESSGILNFSCDSFLRIAPKHNTLPSRCANEEPSCTKDHRKMKVEISSTDRKF